MNTRAFLKSLIVGAVTLPIALPVKEELTKFTSKIPPQPLENRVCFEHASLYFEFFATRNILIPANDGSYSANVYSEFCKIVGTVRDKKDTNLVCKFIRLEGNIIDTRELNECWDKEIQTLTNLAVEKFNSSKMYDRLKLS